MNASTLSELDGSWVSGYDRAFYRCRWYDPHIGRFTSMDEFEGSTADPNTLHKYLYANANPVINSDPTGMFSVGFDVAAALSIGRILSLTGSSVARSVGLANGLSLRDIDPFSTSLTDSLTSFASWMNDRPPGAAEGWEEFVPLYGSLKNSMAYLADGRWGWGAFHSIMAVADAFLVSKLVTGIGRAGLAGARSLLARAFAETAAESFAARKAGWRFVSSTARVLGGGLGATNLRTGEVFIADNLVGDALVETIRHELVHQAMTPTNSTRATIRIIGYNHSHLLRFTEEFLAELYGTGSIQRAFGLASTYNISFVRAAGEAGAYVATISVGAGLAYNLSHGVDGVF